MPAAKKTQNNTIRILGIETSCDETSVALLSVACSGSEVNYSNCTVLLKKHWIATQIPIHARYGGVVPEVAARTHVAEIVSLLEKALGVKKQKIQSGHRSHKDSVGLRSWNSDLFDVIAVTQGPGLATALRVGINAAKTLAWAYDKPMYPVNHLEGHMASAWLVPANRKHWQFPILFLLVSGGHTELVVMFDFGKYKVLGRTRDDAAGEAFDKTGKLLGLPYPGGPHLSKLAAQGNPKAFTLPRPMLHDPSLDFSFSGLKTAARQLVESSKLNAKRLDVPALAVKHKDQGVLEDMCASIQAAIVETLVAKTIKAVLKVKPMSVAVVGGVSANQSLKIELRKALRKACPGVVLLAPATGLYTDNSAMIAAAGAWSALRGKKIPRWQSVDAEPDLDL